MSSISEVVSVSITLEGSQVSVASFGVPLIAAHHTAFADTVRVYDSDTMLADLVADGIPTTHRAYALAQALLSADTRVSQVMLGKRATAWNQTTAITPLTVADATVYSVKVNGTIATFTSDADATIAEICTGLAAALDALPLVTATSDGTKVTVVTTLADSVAVFSEAVNVSVDDITPDAGIAADLTAFAAANEGWYGWVNDSPSNLEKLAGATWTESQVKIFATTINGTRALDSSDTTDTASTGKASNYKRTLAVYHSDVTKFAGETLLGVMLPHDPSQGDNWAWRTLSGVPVETLTASQRASLVAKGIMVYTTIGGVSVTKLGVTWSGTRFVDQTTLIDELTARIQERVFAALLNDLPYTDEAADSIVGEILGELQLHVQRGSIAGNPAPTASHPLVSTVSSVNKANRHLPDVRFTAQTAGRINSVAIQGKLVV